MMNRGLLLLLLLLATIIDGSSGANFIRGGSGRSLRKDGSSGTNFIRGGSGRSLRKEAKKGKELIHNSKKVNKKEVGSKKSGKKKGGNKKSSKKKTTTTSEKTSSGKKSAKKSGGVIAEPFDPQPTFRSSNGKLEVSLHIGAIGKNFNTPNDFKFSRAAGGGDVGFEANGIGYGGCYGNKRCDDDVFKKMGGPTLRVKPGDDLIIHLHNDLPPEKCKTSDDIGFWNKYHQPSNTNIHVHGLFVPNNENNVLEVVYPGDSLTYNIKIREIQQGGTHWYHPHAEGAVSVQAGGGAAGFIIVEDPEDDIPSEIATLPELLMRIQYYDYTYLSGCPSSDNVWEPSGECNRADSTFSVAKDIVSTCKKVCGQEGVDCGCSDPETECAMPVFGILPYSGTYSQALTVNGAENPVFELHAKQWYRLRTVFVPSYQKSIEPFLEKCDFKLLSKDGRYMPVTPRDIHSGYMFSGSRADFLIRCNSVGTYQFTSIDEVPRPDNWATWNATAQANSYQPADGGVMGLKWDAWVGTLATFKVVESPNDAEVVVDEISPFKPANPCYLPEMRNLEVDDRFYFLQGGWAPPDDTLPDAGETYPVFREDIPPWGGKDIAWYSMNDYINEQNSTAFPGTLSPPKGEEYCEGKRTNEFGECYGTPPTGQDFTFTIGDIVEIDYYAPQIHPLHLHVFGYQITHLPEFAVKNDYFQVGDYHDVLIVPVSGDDDTSTLEKPEYGKVQFRQHIYALETDVVVHCHFYRHSDLGMVMLGKTVGNVGDSSAQVKGTCYENLSDNRRFQYVE